MQVKPKFKQTEIGLLPSDWQVLNLGAAAEFLDGRRKPVKDVDRARMRGEIPYYGASGIVDYVNDFLFDEDLILLGEDGENIVSRNSRLAFRVSGKCWVNNHAHVLKPKNGLDIDYLCEYLEQLKYEQYNSGTAQPKLNKQTCSYIPVAVPPLPEQRAIATALSDVDALINSLDQLIAKKRDIKQATMQQLLTGKTRLPGFQKKDGFKQTEIGLIPEDWDSCSLEEICVHGGLVRGPFGGHLRKDLFVSSGYKVYEQRNAIYRDCEMGAYFITAEKFSELKRFSVLPEDFILSCSGTIGRIYRIPVGAMPGIINQALLKIRIHQSAVAPEYFYHFFRWSNFQSKIIDNTQGGAMQNLVGMSVFRKTRLAMPSLSEQHAIAEVLSDMESALLILERRRDKTILLKQGMMQELLTGRTRLV